LVVILLVLSVLYGAEQRRNDRAAAAYKHLKSKVPEDFPIHLPEGAGKPIK
jgi:hypothetical protein